MFLAKAPNLHKPKVTRTRAADNLATGGVAGYVDRSYPNLFEDENGPDQLLEVDAFTRQATTPHATTHDWRPEGLATLPADIAAESGAIFVRDAADFDDADYWCQIDYEQRHRR